MTVNSRAGIILLLLAFAPLRLQAADDTNKPPAHAAYDPAAVDAVAGAVSGTPDRDDLCDWSEGHVVAAPGVTPPPADDQAKLMKSILLKLARRLVEVQQKTPDPHIQTIIDQSHLGDTAALAALPPDQAQQALVRTAVALVEAAKTDTLAAHLTDEFKISFKPGTPSASPPSTNAPTAAAT